MSPSEEQHTRLDELIRRALVECVDDLRSTPWFGRENELVNLFVFGHLLRLAPSMPGALDLVASRCQSGRQFVLTSLFEVQGYATFVFV